ncbi:DNA methylase [Lactococcus phage 936 group phage Phi91127]|uniref:DNA methylase n=2 Tax=Skunavirus sv91127 TaxID=2845448 RepID=A0A126HC93_9CAUD|nr:DNA methylase [Lactococcus phage 936 group phage Phi91127]ALM64228.1 DNA methylase [Lactococcus phage 936 group phage Phi91127]ALM64286.1 DNA methylase [Lactococcus phage 936 group phage PhiM.5]
MIELNKIYNEECLEGMKKIPDGSVDMILCDLPYGTTACTWDEIIPFKPLWEQYERVIKDNGAIVLTASQPFTSKLVMSNIKWFKHEWIWEKQRASNFMRANHEPLKYHENILVFSKGLLNFNPQRYKVLEIDEIMTMTKKEMEVMMKSKHYDRFGRVDKRKTVRGPNENKKYLGSEIKRVRNADDGFRNPKSVLKINNKLHGNIHPTQKPVPLFEYLIRTYTNKGDTVLDNCMGSGTTAIACLNTERNFIGFELNEEYYNMSLKRISEKRI